jgi:hypothetical protein
MDEITQLVNEYNAAEAAQEERLTRLYDLLDARKGYRKVDFGGGHVWSNAWGRGDRRDLAQQAFIDVMVRPITEIVTGEAA